jgi:hypothetical protein
MGFTAFHPSHSGSRRAGWSGSATHQANQALPAAQPARDEYRAVVDQLPPKGDSRWNICGSVQNASRKYWERRKKLERNPLFPNAGHSPIRLSLLAAIGFQGGYNLAAGGAGGWAIPEGARKRPGLARCGRTPSDSKAGRGITGTISKSRVKKLLPHSHYGGKSGGRLECAA